MITVRDDERVRTHDEAEQLLRYLVPGARVRIERPVLRHWAQNHSERSRGYTITVRRGGAEDVCVVGSYSLPAPAARIAQNALEQVRARTGEK